MSKSDEKWGKGCVPAILFCPICLVLNKNAQIIWTALSFCIVCAPAVSMRLFMRSYFNAVTVCKVSVANRYERHCIVTHSAVFLGLTGCVFSSLSVSGVCNWLLWWRMNRIERPGGVIWGYLGLSVRLQWLQLAAAPS